MTKKELRVKMGRKADMITSMINWNESYRLGIKIIDEQHQEFVVALNSFLESLGKDSVDKGDLNQIFEQMAKYIKFHFATEEKYFAEFNYDGAQEHKLLHRLFIETWEKLKAKYLDDQVETSFDIADFLEDWLINHLANVDKKYVACFKAHGLTD